MSPYFLKSQCRPIPLLKYIYSNGKVHFILEKGFWPQTTSTLIIYIEHLFKRLSHSDNSLKTNMAVVFKIIIYLANEILLSLQYLTYLSFKHCIIHYMISYHILGHIKGVVFIKLFRSHHWCGAILPLHFEFPNHHITLFITMAIILLQLVSLGHCTLTISLSEEHKIYMNHVPILYDK